MKLLKEAAIFVPNKNTKYITCGTYRYDGRRAKMPRAFCEEPMLSDESWESSLSDKEDT